ncbi:receptor activity-modifying protein 2 isoform X8 [Grus americana]|uniref:receptor activity-modifying protein 2 isoform X8 n=1 Tax=Grus americana TaxID=9117 RepID=UPI0024077C45|nr:receptor activity-modifying protein 2 isoform X8 [Grus americana]
MLVGKQLLCCLLLPLLQRGHGDAEYWDLEDEGHYLYLDEDEAPATRPEAPAAPTKNRTRGAPTLRPPECQGLMASRCSRSPVKGPAVPRSGGSHGMRRVGQLCQDFCWGTRSPARSSFRSREGPSELRFIALGFTLCGSRGRAVKGEALGSHSALGQR